MATNCLAFGPFLERSEDRRGKVFWWTNAVEILLTHETGDVKQVRYRSRMLEKRELVVNAETRRVLHKPEQRWLGAVSALCKNFEAMLPAIHFS